MKIGFVGLGVMGFPMAGRLVAAGHQVTVYNRSPERAQRWAATYAGAVADDPAAVAANADLVMACVGDDPDVEAVAGRVLDALPADAVFVDHTTASPALARTLSRRFADAGCGFVDAPVSGGQAGAEAGTLSVMCGGEKAHVERARAAFGAYAARVTHVGGPGAGQLCKAVNQICIAGLLQGLAEGVHFAQSAGLDVDVVLEAVTAGAARSWQMENRARTMAQDQFDFGFAVDWMRKDLRIALAEARTSGASLPVTALVDQFYSDVQAMGGGRWDTSSLIRRLNRR